MRTFKLIIVSLALLAIFGIGSCAAYYLPSTEKVQLTGTEVRRFDPRTQSDRGMSHDVRYIQARSLDDSEMLVFRNEDTRWSWPFYFKFNAADLSAQASDILQTNKDAIVLVTYYGVRSRLLDLYPNAVSLRIVDADYHHVPLFNAVFLAVFFGLCVLIVVKLRQLVRWSSNKWQTWREKKS